MITKYTYSGLIDSREYEDVCLLAEILVAKKWTKEEENKIYEHFRVHKNDDNY